MPKHNCPMCAEQWNEDVCASCGWFEWKQPLYCHDFAGYDELTMEFATIAAQAPAPAWQPIETAPKDRKAWFWLVPKSEHETYTDTAGRPILSGVEPHAQVCMYKGWGALMKATHWQEYVIPAAPGVAAAPPVAGTPEDLVTCNVSKIRQGDENDGPLESTDLYLKGRGISLLVNVEAPGVATYSLRVDGEDKGSGYVGTPEAGSPAPAEEPR